LTKAKEHIFDGSWFMNETLQNFVLKQLCPDGVWQLSDIVKSLLSYQLSRLPKGEVSEDETRYPQSPVGMRAFLMKFFARHYFQTQNSLFNYMTSQDFFDVFRSGHLRILDVGSGPAVASLAITNMLVCVLEHLKGVGDWPKGKMAKLEYVLNDTSGICLGTGQRMLNDYFQITGRNNTGIIHSRTTRIQKAFPDNMSQLRRIAHNLGTYDMVTFCYVISPLNEDKGFDGLVDGLLDIERLCNVDGRILILQDRFQVALVRRMSKAIGVSSRKEESTQQVYPSNNTNETYTYTYYRCLYTPSKEMTIKQSYVA
jgi:ribosomal protein RSM22 (predicted rRNA methylase)